MVSSARGLPVAPALLALLSLFAGTAEAAEFIPGIHGFADTQGPFSGNGTPAICVVDTLAWNADPPQPDDDYDGSGVAVHRGSLRACLENTDYCAAGQGRIILFETSGVINAGGSYSQIRLRDLGQPEGSRGIGHIWVAGQTAPSPGITLYNIKIINHGNHTIWQHLRFRLDDNGLDCLQAQNHKAFLTENYPGDPDEVIHTIFANNSITFGIDILGYFGGHSTVANNILAFGLSQSVHPKNYDYRTGTEDCNAPANPDEQCACQFVNTPTPQHSKGAAVSYADHASLTDNLLAFNDDRNPYISHGPTNIWIANNLIHHATFAMHVQSTGVVTAAAVGNVHQRTDGNPSEWFATISNETGAGSELYFFDNACDQGSQADASDWTHLRLRVGATTSAQVTSPPVTLPGYTPVPSDQLAARVLPRAGARPLDRDWLDQHVVHLVQQRQGGFIDAPEELDQPFEDLAENTRGLYSEMAGSDAGPMPTDPFADDDDDGTANIAEWLFGLHGELVGDQGGAGGSGGSAAGGAGGSGATSAGGSAGGQGGAGNGAAATPGDEDDGCGCRLVAGGGSSPAGLPLLAMALVVRALKRRKAQITLPNAAPPPKLG